MILAAYGIPDYSLIQVSEFLRHLRMSHTIEGGFRHMTHTIDGLCREQPVWPVVVSQVRAVPKIRSVKEHTVLLVCDCRAALSTTNIDNSLWPEYRASTIEDGLKNALLNAHLQRQDWALVNNEPTTLEYVNSATKPSFLNGIQSALYKITPYSLRKEVQQLVISYLSGGASYTVLNKKLKSSLKLQTLSELVQLPKAKELREAVLMLSTLSVDEVSKKTGFETFELLYLQKSSAKTSETAKTSKDSKGKAH